MLKYLQINLCLCILALLVAQTEKTSILVGLQWKFKLHSTLPIKNSTQLAKSASRFFLDANEVAEIISSQTKAEVAFISAVSNFSDEIFIPADCYIPLCRTEPAPLSWTETDIEALPFILSESFNRRLQTVENFRPANIVEFESCCALADTRLEEDEESECIVNPLQSCRTQVYEAPCGDIFDRSEFSRSLQLTEEATCIENEASMEIEVRFFDLENDETCCLQCGCFGDPRCVNFNGESDIWVLCDGRGPNILEDDESSCVIREDVCLEQLDHDGNQCQWLELSANELENFSTLRNGSRCLPNEASGESWILMYEFEEFAFSVEQIERGIIETVEIRLGEDLYFMSAEDCLEADFNRSWTDDEDNFIVPTSSFVQIVQNFDLFTEVVWAIAQDTTAMHVRLRCLQQRDTNGNESAPRIHVEALVEPESNFEGRGNVEGFCVNGQFDTVASSTANTDLIEAGEGCTVSRDISKNEEIQIARALCGEGVLYGNIPTCLVSFCEENYFPSFIDPMQCIISFGDGVEGFVFRETFCKATTFTESDSLICQELWDTVGALDAINVYYLNVNRPDLEEDCSEGVSDLPTELGECEAGVELQYLNERLEWITFVGIAERRPPCGNLEFNIVDHREIFENPIRWKQCTISSACITATNSLCRTQSSFVSDILLRPVSVEENFEPTQNPSAAPSEFPTIITTAPSESPTRMETEKPTVTPTEFPTEAPTDLPTSAPTNFPIVGLTEKPTTSPTSFPSVSPVVGITVAPTKEKIYWGDSKPTFRPTETPTDNPTTEPTAFPTRSPTDRPTRLPTLFPTQYPTSFPTTSPTNQPTTLSPTESPTSNPSVNPTISPTLSPTRNPTISPTLNPTVNPTSFPTLNPTESPTLNPTTSPTKFPTVSPTEFPTSSPTFNPTENPTNIPTISPSFNPTFSPVESPTETPTATPSKLPTRSPTGFPTESPTESPTNFPTQFPTWSPSKFPTSFPTRRPTSSPLPVPTESPTDAPTVFPTVFPTERPTNNPTESPTFNPTARPTVIPTNFPLEKGHDGDWGSGEMFLNFDVRANSVAQKTGFSTQKFEVSKKLDYAEAGEVVFYAMYKTEEDAERELLAADPAQLVDAINAHFGEYNQDVVAVTCDMSVLVSESFVEAFPETAESDEPQNKWDFFDLGNNFNSLIIVIALGFVALAIVILLVVISPAKKALSSTELVQQAFDL